MRVTLQAIAAAADINYKTMSRHLVQLKEQGVFTKKSPGKQFNRDEVKALENIYGFKFKAAK